ncbi:chromosome-associated kinesin KIF4-like [Diabrotica undecimpunctata]|uniref:chromosome-associated kinesin KIF4-like n=1 Tax=Diabrotica undecimpunctata TaxID=50387 RepID=UPI003B63C6CC
MGMSHMVCAAKNCNNKAYNCDASFFSFPKDKARALVWLLQSGREDLKSKIDKLDSYKLCGDHFEKKFFRNYLKNRLHLDAIPRIFPSLEGSSIEERQNEHNYAKSSLCLLSDPAVCTQELDSIKKENIDFETNQRDLSLQLATALFNNTDSHGKIINLQNASDVLTKKLVRLKEICDATLNSYSRGLQTNNDDLIKENLATLDQIKEQLAQINSDQKQIDTEIANHEHNMKDFAEGGNEQSEDTQEKQESHTNRQLNLNVQLTEIEKQLNIKENLAQKLINANYVVDYQTIAENEAKIAQLEQEKVELQHVLKHIVNPGKWSEQRRKRVQDLEHQLIELKKKVQEQNQLIKTKAKDEERIKVLNKEILELTQTKVKLAMGEECEIARMKVIHSKQQNVFKRRVEEAEAVNRRLKLALSVKQQAQESKNTGKAERIEPWLKQEFDLYVTLLEAETMLNVLLEDQATVQHQLDEMRNNSDENPTDYKSIEDDLVLRSVQIQDLQQHLLDSNEDTEAKTRIDKFQTMAEAKYGINFLFARAAELVKEKVSLQMKLTKLQELYSETQEKLQTQGEEAPQMRQDYEKNITSFLIEIGKNKDSFAKRKCLQKQTEEVEVKKEELTETLQDVFTQEKLQTQDEEAEQIPEEYEEKITLLFTQSSESEDSVPKEEALQIQIEELEVKNEEFEENFPDVFSEISSVERSRDDDFKRCSNDNNPPRKRQKK